MPIMDRRESDEQYGEQEAQQRFEKIVHVALKTPPEAAEDNGIQRRACATKESQEAREESRRLALTS